MNGERPEASELYKWAQSEMDLSFLDECFTYLDDCVPTEENYNCTTSLDEDGFLRAYSEVEVYGFDRLKDEWTGPSVYFSPVRRYLGSTAAVFDIFWADDMRIFENDTCFKNYCEGELFNYYYS